ncbi:hypothetical protein PG989_005647 [Apiospora arundinis]
MACHGTERVLIAVRKPGRPLRQCPHPAGRPCSCHRHPQSVTAALPRKPKCDCIANAEGPLPSAPELSRSRASGASTPAHQPSHTPSQSSTPASTISTTVSNATAVTTASAPDAASDGSGLDPDQSASQPQAPMPAPLQANATENIGQTITIHLSLCATCLSQPQQNIVFQLPLTLGNNGLPIIVQLPAHQASSQGPTTTHIVPQIFESQGHASTSTLAPTPRIPTQHNHNPAPQGQTITAVASLGGECGSGHCNCGPSCPCVGCVVHPYNSATEDFVFSAYQNLVDFPDQQGQGQLWDSQQSALAAPAVAPGGLCWR